MQEDPFILRKTFFLSESLQTLASAQEKAMNNAYLSGFGCYAPEICLTNKDLESRVDTTDEWIVTRTGIRERRFMTPEQNVSDLATLAARHSLQNAGVDAQAITHALVATCTPETLCPSTACVMTHKLGISPLMVFDFSAACSGFLYGMKIAQGLLAADPDACLLVVGVEGISRRLNWADRGTCVLFGDGAGACLVSGKPAANGPSALIVDIISATDGSKSQLIRVGGGSAHGYLPSESVVDEFFLSMQGRDVFKYAVRAMSAISASMLEKNGLTVDDIDLFVPHQANLRIIESVGQRLGIASEKVFVNVESYGNTSAASVPLALAEAVEQGRVKSGMTVLITTFGSGFTWGAALLKIV